MKLIVQNSKVVAAMGDDYVPSRYDDAVIDAPEGFDYDNMHLYSYVDGQLVFPSESVNREKRNSLLTECDWTQLADVPLTTECKTAFADYRQALRAVDLLNPTWPDKPAEEWVP